MMLDKIDLAWSLVLMTLALVGLWKVYEHRKQYWKAWPWHAALAIAWTVSVPLNFATGDTVFAWIGVALAALEVWNWITYRDRSKLEREIEKKRAEVFEAFRIDNPPKN